MLYLQLNGLIHKGHFYWNLKRKYHKLNVVWNTLVCSLIIWLPEENRINLRRTYDWSLITSSSQSSSSNLAVHCTVQLSDCHDVLTPRFVYKLLTTSTVLTLWRYVIYPSESVSNFNQINDLPALCFGLADMFIRTNRISNSSNLRINKLVKCVYISLLQFNLDQRR